jgi:hypothetical protein
MQNAANKAAAAQEEKNRQAQTVTEAVPPNNEIPAKSKAKRTDVFSPGINSIKEILDITYAVQRMGEEKKNNRAKAAIPQHGLGGYDSISEDDEDDTSSDGSQPDDISSESYGIQREVIAMAEQLAQDGKGVAPASYATIPQQQYTHNISTPVSSRRKRNVFELDMNNATILRNRRVQV